MKTSDFDYDLPASFIAQRPAEPRDAARLMVLNRKTGEIQHDVFKNIRRYLRSGDLLILNETKVIPARLRARKETGGKAELLLLHREDSQTWECLVGGGGIGAGRTLILEDGLKAHIINVLDGPRRRVRFDEPVEKHLPRDGQMPLPPYIHEQLTDPERYQTVYAKNPGSVAAPTAGLHFTRELMEALQKSGVNIAYVTLHVGLDTFAPVTEDDPAEHRMHTEWCEIRSQTVEKINKTKEAGGRIIAVGTTSVRTLESAAQKIAAGDTWSGPTALFILPGYQFRIVDAIITNFHLPKSTLIMLVSAFAGRENILKAYAIAKEEHYRFFSFGDAMFIE